MMDLLIGATVKGTVVLLATWIVSGLMRRASSDLRHRIWLLALVSMVIILIPLPVPDSARIVVTLRPAAEGGTMLASDRVYPLVMITWTVGALLLLARFAAGLFRLMRLTRLGEPFGTDCVVLRASESPVPMTWGVWKPVILLPDYVMGWPREKRDLVILHEQAHIQRRDWLWHAFARLVTALFWFHPLVWMAASRLRAEGECAADDLVLIGGADPADYAHQLLVVARTLTGSISPYAATMARGQQLDARISAILDSSRVRGCTGLHSRRAMAGLAVVLAVVLAACQSARVYRVAQVAVPPRVVSKVEPDYTQAARDAKTEGAVVLGLVINPQGRAENIRVVKSVDVGLGRNAVAAIEHWQFSPGIKDGKPVRVAAIIEVNFRLR